MSLSRRRSSSPQRAWSSMMLRSVFGRNVSPGVMKGNRHPPAIGVTVAQMAAPLGVEGEAVAHERADELPSGQRAEAAPVDRAHTVTEMSGSSETCTLAGTSSHSSTSSATTISSTSRMWVSASSRVRPQVAAP